MKKQFALFAAFIILAFFAVSASAQGKPVEPPKPKIEEPKKTESSLLAKWAVVISAPDQEYIGTLLLEKSGDGFKGSVTTELGEAPLGNIKIDGDSFSGTILANIQGQSFDGTIAGKLKDGKITGEINLNGIGAIPYTGKKP